MAQKSKFFRVAVDGATTDGRTIDRSWIEQMARNFDPQKYGARIWLEHIRGIYPDSDFRAYGDVTAVKAEEVTIDGKKKLALFAQIAPLPDLVAMTTKNKQKVYTSIEVNPKFADTGEAYLVGLGVTDSPASLGTDVLSFAAQNPKASRFDRSHPTLSYPMWTRQHYARGANADIRNAGEHKRLQAASVLNRQAALASASWGKFQILGANFKACGFATLQSFINSMYAGEGAQLQAFVRFVKHEQLDDEMRELRWTDFARRYNGSRYAENNYDGKLAAAYRKHA